MKKNNGSVLEKLFVSKRDRFLVNESIAGNSAAFATLMSLYQKRVEAVGMRFFHNQAETEDFVQDVFLKVYNNLSSFEGKSSFSTWLTRIAFNTAQNSSKSKKENDTLCEEESIYSIYDSPEEAHIKELTKQAVKEAVNNLPENYAHCIELYFFFGMTYEDIAETTELPLNTIKSHIFRAKKILCNKLKEYKE